MVYALMEEVVVNKATVEEIKTVYIDEITGVVHAAPKADSKDGIAEAFNKDEQAQWKPLGSKVRLLMSWLCIGIPYVFFERRYTSRNVTYNWMRKFCSYTAIIPGVI